jgi:hypothetical protein
MSTSERSAFAPNDYGTGVSGAAKHGIEAYGRFSYGESFGSNSALKGMNTSDLNLVGQGHGSFTSWDKLDKSPMKQG